MWRQAEGENGIGPRRSKHAPHGDVLYIAGAQVLPFPRTPRQKQLYWIHATALARRWHQARSSL